MTPASMPDRLPLALFFLRLSVFVVMLMWTLINSCALITRLGFSSSFMDSPASASR